MYNYYVIMYVVRWPITVRKVEYLCSQIFFFGTLIPVFISFYTKDGISMIFWRSYARQARKPTTQDLIGYLGDL